MFLKINGVQNQLPISFGTALVCIKISKVINSPPHTLFLSGHILFSLYKYIFSTHRFKSHSTAY